MPLLPLLLLSLAAARLHAQAPAADTPGGLCTQPVGRSACPHACPVVDGAARCVPVLGACDACAAPRGPADGVCAPELACVDGECRGADVGARCGDNGRVCDEGLVCTQGLPVGGFPLAGKVCYNGGAEGERCDIDSYLSKENPQFRGCAEGLNCVLRTDGGGGRTCQTRTREGDKCSRNEDCPEKDLSCRLTGGKSICSKARGGGEPCSNTFDCSPPNENGQASHCFENKCRPEILLGGACDPNDASRPCGDGLSKVNPLVSCVPNAAGGHACSVPLRLGAPCGNSTGACWREGMPKPFRGFRIVSMRCEAGFCAEDVGAGGLLQLCSGDQDCAAAGLVCGKAQDGQVRCLRKPQERVGEPQSASRCSMPLRENVGIGQVLCQEGFSCKTHIGSAEIYVGRGFCIKDGPQPIAGLGDVCDPDANLFDGNFIQCADTDDSGNRLVCRPTSDKTKRRCVRYLNDGESCATESSICGDGGNLWRTASCDGSNVCRVSKAGSCKSDGECNTAEGEGCASVAKPYVGTAELFSCVKYNRQGGETCQSKFTSREALILKCAEGLTCFEDEGTGAGRGGRRCVQTAKDGERCGDEENIVCDGVSALNVEGGFVARSACRNGSCQPL